MPSAAATSLDHIPALVRAGDRDRYWAGLLMPQPARGRLFALYAFNIELARIGEQVREPQLGEIRLQWWRDTLAAPRQAMTGNPVADALADARIACDLPAELLGSMIDARVLDVHRESIATMGALRSYLTATAGAVFRLGAWIAGARNSATARASEEAAMAYGLTGLLRALPYHAARGQLYIPADFLEAFGVDPGAILQGRESDEFRAAFGVLRDRAQGHYAAFRQLARELPAAALPVFLPLALVPAYLRKLGDPAHKVLGEVVQLNPLHRYARIWLANAVGKI